MCETKQLYSDIDTKRVRTFLPVIFFSALLISVVYSDMVQSEVQDNVGDLSETSIEELLKLDR